ncbi:MAG: 1,2-phenylacetyl-CoA epoxidase subunit PaaD [Bacillota bacterium]|nr:1,2-phenylacetyl-CoA epoxidase subunit PaaD [Bacillota bacterium]MDP4170783.1 1,2-phenylacetyl-CoA epoxidase subunit PaaD [Bacillota bacterium]
MGKIIFAEKLETKILKALYDVSDPEIASISIVDLGMLESVIVSDSDITIHLIPTFVGCPALDIIRKNVEKELLPIAEDKRLNVQFIHNIPWTSNRITEDGRLRLKEFGIAPPPRYLPEDGSWEVNCPYCDSVYTAVENLFGPTACRSIFYCKNCKNPFEAMKLLSEDM